MDAQLRLPAFGLASVTRTPCNSDTDSSTVATVSLMQQYIQAASQSPAIQQALSQAMYGIADSAPAWRKADAIWHWVRKNFRFQTDESILATSFGMGPDNELLIRPELFLQVRRGDCDDFSMLTCALLKTAGCTARLVTIAADPSEPQRFSHVYALVVLENGNTIPMDTSHGRYFGWESPRAYRRQEWIS